MDSSAHGIVVEETEILVKTEPSGSVSRVLNWDATQAYIYLEGLRKGTINLCHEVGPLGEI